MDPHPAEGHAATESRAARLQRMRVARVSVRVVVVMGKGGMSAFVGVWVCRARGRGANEEARPPLGWLALQKKGNGAPKAPRPPRAPPLALATSGSRAPKRPHAPRLSPWLVGLGSQLAQKKKRQK